jgi:hypothetical protein
MFQNDRYVTKGIANTLSVPMQMLLWYLIDTMEKEKDYLQVFELEPDGEKQKIIHTPEQPPFRSEPLLNFGEPPVRAKIFVIDDKDYSTMLLAEEY